MQVVELKEIGAVEFVNELVGYVKEKDAKDIFMNIAHFSETKKNIIIDLLRVNPDKYIPVLLDGDE